MRSCSRSTIPSPRSRLNRPETLNALTLPMLAAFREAVESAARDPQVVGIVITGAGRGFCSGLDASVLQATTTTGSSSRPTSDDVPGMFTWLLSIPKPVISAVNGVAAGGGFVLTVMSDLRIASTAGSFTTIFSKRGLVAEHGTTWIVPRLIGTGAALDLLWSSRKIDAAEAHRLGLVQQVVEPDDLARRGTAVRRRPRRERVARLARRHQAPRLRGLRRDAIPTRSTTIDGVQYAALDRVDAKEGAAALIEKRPPNFPRLRADGRQLMDFETIRYEVAGGLCRLTLDRPDHMNAMTNQMVREAYDALELRGGRPVDPGARAHRRGQGVLPRRRPQPLHQRRPRRGAHRPRVRGDDAAPRDARRHRRRHQRRLRRRRHWGGRWPATCG